MIKAKFAHCCSCGMNYMNFVVGPDYIYLTCKNCSNKGVLIPFSAWEEMRKPEYKNKIVKVTGEDVKIKDLV